ncbi:MAG: L-histidine N(alpha)-methyltransferase [Mucilaginibacter sp.]
MLTQTGTSKSIATENKQFYEDVLKGLRAEPKYLQSKYFYDSNGDKLFQDIMNSGEYYLTNCEMEIFTVQTHLLVEKLRQGGEPFDLVELGAGDATKSVHLLRQLLQDDADFTYLPIDISGHVIEYLDATLPVSLPGLRMSGLNGEYFDMLKKAASLSNNRKVVLFLGSNIGNMPIESAQGFCNEMRRHLSPGDMVIMGVDLKKNPKTIRAAYDDAEGITRRFNLNLLTRINRELNADFNIDGFDHYCSYDPETGSCKSYLVSLHDQRVSINGETIRFKRDEYIWMEISQKYTVDQLDEMAVSAGFNPLEHLFDSKHWFIDAVLIAE